ncbi:electron transport complex subunit RsxC [Hornefia butyriciproducens]|uniref:Ion-translocating oxidoreductase complex subunit C n=1 Tax=Hornefia butyriciproducens TaxID=2652293 RepID=A0A6L5Y9C5_9FIRM|nr:electron transport complex subunit RsxC [Hornefia butyriciproducens]MCI7680417.1 electron transport complex subunit RsxC [Clostridiales bacterium]MDD6298268.1 electron transport complex subunit RsxC [Hornefia butyriciproducens]MDD7019814.1 electron transport complex subunit RsxC [Hornefia butyriciproducens]MDY2990468.1 electron transport complex subunit RsxC [Hornefia butyriciproducens]MDY5462761.1 electron transport complex subunit RsxC [Hornefia butyriciproducens]
MSSNAKHLHSIDAGHYKNTAGCETEVMPIPDIVKISMSQNIGAPCKPLVKKGDEVKVGQVIGDTDAFVSVPVHASVSGTVTGIETQRNAMGGMDTLVVIEPDKKQELSEEIKVPEITDMDSFVAAVRASGLVGLGGASFPTHIKFNPKNKDEVDTFIINGAECEPFITSDHRTMLEDTQNVIDGALEIMKYLETSQGYIAIEENKPDAIALFDKMIAEQGITNLKTFKLQARYPKGAERVLIYEVTGKECPAGVLPADLGVIVSNVTSVAFFGQYLKDGIPLIKKRMTVDGDAVKTPKNIIAPIGTLIHDVIGFCGGYKTAPKKILMGGPMMGRAIFSDQMPIVKNNNAILAFSEEQAYIPEETACINCGRCHQACPFNLLPTGLAEAYENHDAQMLSDLQVMQCMECGSCSFVCPARRPLAFMNKLGKGIVKEAGIK